MPLHYHQVLTPLLAKLLPSEAPPQQEGVERNEPGDREALRENANVAIVIQELYALSRLLDHLNDPGVVVEWLDVSDQMLRVEERIASLQGMGSLADELAGCLPKVMAEIEEMRRSVPLARKPTRGEEDRQHQENRVGRG